MDSRIVAGESVVLLSNNTPRLMRFVAYSGQSAFLINLKSGHQTAAPENCVTRHSLYNAIDHAKACGFDRVLYRGRWMLFDRFVQRMADRLQPTDQEFVFNHADCLITVQRRANSDFCGAWLCGNTNEQIPEVIDEITI
jgi:hypothetical protein